MKRLVSKEFRRVIDSIWPSYDENNRHTTTAYVRDLTDEEREELK
jgi:hypothetical protein